LFLIIVFVVGYIFSKPDFSTTVPDLVPQNASEPVVTYSITNSVEPAGSGVISVFPNQTTYQVGDEVKLRVEPVTGYEFDRWSGDIAGTSPIVTVTVDKNMRIVAHFKCSDRIAPTISSVRTLKYSDMSCTIEWKTDEQTTSYVRASTDNYRVPIPSRTSDNFTHIVRIPELKPNTSYYARIEAMDQCGNRSKEATYEFSTIPQIFEGHEVGKRARNLVLVPYRGDNSEWTKDLQLNGDGEFELSQFLPKEREQGKKILLDFWSTYCGACIYEFPWIRDIHEKSIEVKKADGSKLNGQLTDYAYLKDWEIITVCVDVYEDQTATREDRIRKVKERFQKLEKKYSQELKGGPLQPTFLYAPSADRQAYHVWTLPMHIFIDEDGIIREIKMQRFMEPGEIREIMDSI
jgi:thiol-disulfide isomerase/thioredoxin